MTTHADDRPVIYLCPTVHCDKLSQLAVGLIDAMGTQFGGRVGIFRPIVENAEHDELIDFLTRQIEGADVPTWGATASDLTGQPSSALAQIINRYQQARAAYDCILVLGSQYDCQLSPVEYAWNTRVAANIDAPVTLVVPSSGDVETIQSRIDVAIDEAGRNHAQVAGVIVVKEPDRDLACTQFVDCPVLVFVVDQVDQATSADTSSCSRFAVDVLVAGEPRPVRSLITADMRLANLLPMIDEGTAVAFSSDRDEIALGLVIAIASGQMPQPPAVIAAGPWDLDEDVVTLWKKMASDVPLLATKTALSQLGSAQMPAASTVLSEAQIGQAKRLGAAAIDVKSLVNPSCIYGQDDVVTPLMFEHRLLERARGVNRHIVLPEGEEERIIRAAGRLLDNKICRLTLLGDPKAITAKADELGVSVDGATLVDPKTDPLREKFATTYAQLRAKKGVTYEQAFERVGDVSYFGTMYVREGLADGMVSGAVNTTAHTIRPAFEVIRTRPGVSVVSSVFFMCLADRVLAMGDCAVNPNPTPEQVADIAITSAKTVAQFGLEPRVALLNYSTGNSGSGPDVDLTKEATRIVKERAPELVVEGPLQYDAAVDPVVARTKMPNNPVAGKATVLIFPDLKTGNTTYKAIQRSANALAVGPVLQGLNKPVNDLSRGALVSDIVNTVAITAIQAALDE